MDKYGFVYIWRDRKHNRYYIGSHWGTVEDGYICSSSWMRNAYKRRPNDFKRRVVAYIYQSRKALLAEEFRWLQMIPEAQLGNRYYNLSQHNNGHWSTEESSRLTVGQKISRRHRGRVAPWSAVPKSKEHRKKLSDALRGRPINYTRSTRTRQLISENTKKQIREGKFGMAGKQHTEATKQKMSANNAMNDPYMRQRISQAKKGAKQLILYGTKRYAHEGTDKYNDLIQQGFSVVKGQHDVQ